MGFYLRTKRTILTQFSQGDEVLLLDLDSDPEVMRYISGGVPSTKKEAECAMERILGHQQRYDNRLGVFRCHLEESGEFMGWFHLRPGKHELDNLDSLELGYRLKQKFWGRGFATEVSRALIEKAFSELGALEVWARTLKGNTASQNVMQKVGMSFLCDYLETEVHGPAEPGVKFHLSRERFLSQKTS